jgi:hypothetical protein
VSDLTTCPACGGTGVVPLDSDEYRRAATEALRQEIGIINDALAADPSNRPGDHDLSGRRRG